MHILAGVHQPDSGSIWFNGTGNLVIENEARAQAMGIGMVYQERSLFRDVTVAENIFVGNQPVGPLGFVKPSRGRMSIFWPRRLRSTPPVGRSSITATPSYLLLLSVCARNRFSNEGWTRRDYATYSVRLIFEPSLAAGQRSKAYPLRP